jgi:peptidoglycan hydrolase-like protein with peptidoglycan-binding domain
MLPAIAVGQRTNARVTRAEIKNAEQHLSDAGFWTGPIDGVFDAGSRSALIAFQKWHGRDVTGQLTIDELDVIRTGSSPGARELGYAHVEVDLDRQVLMLVEDNGSVRVLPTSTGNGKTFMDDGQESISYTPRGRFLVYDKSVGWETGPLGSVYYPNYISGGVAIHGARNVPNQPASHGCIRIPVFAAREVSKLLKVGTIVLVYDKISFVSARDWVTNPQRKEAALLSLSAEVEDVIESTTKTKSGSQIIRRVRPRVVRL